MNIVSIAGGDEMVRGSEKGVGVKFLSKIVRFAPICTENFLPGLAGPKREPRLCLSIPDSQLQIGRPQCESIGVGRFGHVLSLGWNQFEEMALRWLEEAREVCK
jgi:hypothetical protein